MSNELEKWIHLQTQLSKLYVHDFKNPISAIAANLSYLEAVLENVDEDVADAVTDSAVAVKMLLHMMDNYLNISRLEAREPMESVPVPLDRFIADALTRIEKMFTVQEPLLVMNQPVPQGMCFWPMAYTKLAVENLILQSLHNTPSSGKVHLNVRMDGRMVEITVADNGVEIAPEFYDLSFTRDFQVDAKSNENARYGRALAMYSIGLASEVMGGSVRVEKVDALQRFILRLPLEVEL